MKEYDTKGIFEELAEANGEEIENYLKDKLLKEIDTPKNQEGYYLDAFEGPISFNGIRQLKKPYTKLKLNEYQQQEIARCHEDYYYFRKNYCKIVTKAGIGRPEPRPYQRRLEDKLVTGEDVIAFWPRQCISSDTILSVNNEDITAENLFDQCELEEFYYTNPVKKGNYRLDYKTYLKDVEFKVHQTELELSENTERKFIKTIKVRNKLVNTPKGKAKILEVHKTIPYRKFRIELENDLFLEGAYNHVVITSDYKEVYMDNSIGEILITEKGLSKVIKVIDLEKEENMYDISIDSKDELYFSNGILSHNSGKSVTIATYLLWCAITRKNINIGIAANVQKLAVEVLDKIKKIYIEMPIWLQPGLMSWNKKEIEFDNGTKIMTSATNSDSFRGYTINIAYVDEVAFIRPNIWEEFSDAVFPAQEALADKQTILSSTAGGLNHFFFLVEGARNKVKEKLTYKIDGKTPKELCESNLSTYEYSKIIKEDKEYYGVLKKGVNGYMIEEASWMEVPRWNKDGSVKPPEQFKKEQIAKNGVLFWNQNFGNCVGYNTMVNIEGLGSIKIGELYDEM